VPSADDRRLPKSNPFLSSPGPNAGTLTNVLEDFQQSTMHRSKADGRLFEFPLRAEADIRDPTIPSKSGHEWTVGPRTLRTFTDPG